jgi:predicted enzyme related to lactoylglutathione lyase
MRTVSDEELAASLPSVLADVADRGDVFLITRNGRRVATLAPAPSVTIDQRAREKANRLRGRTPRIVRGLRALYTGSDDTERDVRFYVERLGATFRWRFRRYGADVAGLSFRAGPLLILADHRRGKGVLPLYAVDDLRSVLARFTDEGFESFRGPIGTPEGPAILLEDPSGNALALLEVERPDIGDAAYADPANEHAVR